MANSLPMPLDEERFRVTDLPSANWVIQRIAELDRQQQEITNAAKTAIQQWKDWEQQQIHDLDEKRSYWVGLLLAWWTADYAPQHPRHRSVKLPAGIVRWRRMPLRVQVAHPELFTKWAQEEAPDLVRVKVEPNLPAIRSAVVEDGLAIPGVDIVEPEERFEVVPTKGGQAHDDEKLPRQE